MKYHILKLELVDNLIRDITDCVAWYVT